MWLGRISHEQPHKAVSVTTSSGAFRLRAAYSCLLQMPYESKVLLTSGAICKYLFVFAKLWKVAAQKLAPIADHMAGWRTCRLDSIPCSSCHLSVHSVSPTCVWGHIPLIL